jgi:hypothetical protein
MSRDFKKVKPGMARDGRLVWCGFGGVAIKQSWRGVVWYYERNYLKVICVGIVGAMNAVTKKYCLWFGEKLFAATISPEVCNNLISSTIWH